MKKLIKRVNTSWLPDYIADNVLDIDFEFLKDSGAKACIFDLDHTILIQNSHIVDEATITALREVNLDIFIATNRRHSAELDKIVEQIGAKGIVFAKSFRYSKPAKKYFFDVINLSGFAPHELVMIGDRLIQDGWGAKRLGIRTVMVKKLGRIYWYGYFNSLQDLLLPIVFRQFYRDL